MLAGVVVSVNLAAGMPPSSEMRLKSADLRNISRSGHGSDLIANICDLSHTTLTTPLDALRCPPERALDIVSAPAISLSSAQSLREPA